jgi:hypothetical protein
MTKPRRTKVKFGGTEIPELFTEKLRGRVVYYFKNDKGNKIRREDLKDAIQELNKYKQSINVPVIPILVEEGAISQYQQDKIEVLDAAVHYFQTFKIDIEDVLRSLLNLCTTEGPASFVHENVGGIIMRLLHRAKMGNPTIISGVAFPPDALVGKELSDIKFERCYFQPTSTYGCSLEKCTFKDTTFERIELEKNLNVKDVDALNITVLSIVLAESDTTIFAPDTMATALKHVGFKYTIIYVPFENWQDPGVWAIEHLIAQPYMNLYEKLELSFSCKGYWLQKEAAKQNQGARTDLPKIALGKSEDSKEVCRIIAEKVGCSVPLVYAFKEIHFSKKEELKKECRTGEKSISAAYKELTGKSSAKKTKNEPKSQTSSCIAAPASTAPAVSIINSDILHECENNIDVGKKNVHKANGTPPASVPIVDKVAKTRISHPDHGLCSHCMPSANCD